MSETISPLWRDPRRDISEIVFPAQSGGLTDSYGLSGASFCNNYQKFQKKQVCETRFSTGSGEGSVTSEPVSISCRIKPYVRFSLIRLTDNLLPELLNSFPAITGYIEFLKTAFFNPFP